MEGKDRAFHDPSFWTTGAHDSDGTYNNRLSELGWSFYPDLPNPVRSLLPAGPVEPAAVSKSNSNNQPVSPCSSEDPPEKSTASDAKPPETPIRIKKKGEKRLQQPRFAFMTKTQIDNLEDGYRWRKYGQKAVKNSSFPRSYYRCTNSKCTVKKRVERSWEDPSIVITTYEGQHSHHSTVGFPRNGIVSHEAPSQMSHPHFYYPLYLPIQNAPTFGQPLQYQTPDEAVGSSSVMPHQGVLADIMPSVTSNI